MSFRIPNPEFKLFDKIRIAFWAWRDSKIPGQPTIADDGYFESNRIATFACKAKEAIAFEIAGQSAAKKTKSLKSLYARYTNLLSKLQRARADRAHAVAKAESRKHPEDEGLDPAAFALRSSTRATKAAAPFDTVISELEGQLDDIAVEANGGNGLVDYESRRVAVFEHCLACEERFYYRVGHAYCQSLRRRLKIETPLSIRPLSQHWWIEEINKALPALDFTQHNNHIDQR